MNGPSRDPVRFGDYAFDRVSRLLYRRNKELALPPRAVGVLACLIDRAGEIVSKQELLDEVWKDAYVTDTSLAEAISLLRQTLQDEVQRPQFIQTVPRRGYRFIGVSAPSSAVPPTVDAFVILPPASSGPSTPPASSPMSPPIASTSGVASTFGDILPGSRSEIDEEPWPPWLAWTLLLATLGTFIWVLVHVSEQPAFRTRPVARFVMTSGDGVWLDVHRPFMAMAPDGSRVAFVAVGPDGVSRLHVRELDQIEPTAIAGSEGASAPFFSPDGQRIGFFASGAIRTTRLGDGPPVVVCQASDAFGATWTDDNEIIFAASLTGGLSRVPASGGTPVALTTPDATHGELHHAWPEAIPGTRSIAFVILGPPSAPELARIALLSLSDRNRPLTLLENASFPKYSATGHLLFVRNRQVHAVPFDAETGALLGPDVAVLDTVATDPATSFAHFAMSASGTLAYLPDRTRGRLTRLSWIGNGSSTSVDVPADTQMIRGLALGAATSDVLMSKDAKAMKLALAIGDAARVDVWSMGVADGDLHRITSTGQNVAPVFGLRDTLFYSHQRSGPFNIEWRTSSPGAAPPTRLSSPHHQFPSSISQDAHWLIYTDVHPSTGLDLWALPLTSRDGSASSDRQARPLSTQREQERAGVLSSDGQWLAYQIKQGTIWSVAVRRVTDLLGRSSDANATSVASASRRPTNPAPAETSAQEGPFILAPSDGGRVLWSPNDQQLLFTHNRRLLAAHVTGLTTGGVKTVELDRLEPLSASADAIDDFAIAGDGRILVLARPAPPRATALEIVLEWSRELSARSPVTPRTPRPPR